MSFRQAVQHTPGLADAWMPGLQALRTKDRPHIDPENTQLLQGSADIDSALTSAHPTANRWDFAIAYRHSNPSNDCIYWVEIHTATDKEIKVVLRKLEWLKQWLAAAGNLLNAFEKDFVWISSGATSFTATSPQAKRFSVLGLRHTGRKLRIPTIRP